MPRILMTGAAGEIGTRLRQLLPPVYPDPSVPCAYVEIYWRARNADEPASPWTYADTIAPTGSIKIPYDPDLDRDVEIAPMPYSANGTPAFATIEHAFETIGETLAHQRETNAPTIGQNSPATADMMRAFV